MVGKFQTVLSFKGRKRACYNGNAKGSICASGRPIPTSGRRSERFRSNLHRPRTPWMDCWPNCQCNGNIQRETVWVGTSCYTLELQLNIVVTSGESQAKPGNLATNPGHFRCVSLGGTQNAWYASGFLRLHAPKGAHRQGQLSKAPARHSPPNAAAPKSRGPGGASW